MHESKNFFKIDFDFEFETEIKIKIKIKISTIDKMKMKYAELEQIMHPALKEQMKKNKIKLETKHLKILGKVTEEISVKVDFLYLKTSFGQFMFCSIPGLSL